MGKVTQTIKGRNYKKPLSMAIIIYTPVLTRELKRKMTPKQLLAFFRHQGWHVVFAPENFPENFYEAGDLHPPAEKPQRAGIKQKEEN